MHTSAVSDQELAAAIAELPPVSAVLQRILAVLHDPHSGLDDIARLIRAETALAAQVLRLANSAHYGFTEPVDSIQEAIQRLGVAEVHRLVSALGSRQLFLRPLSWHGLTADALWQHTIAVAVCAETVATYAQADRASGYLAGILHPIGIVALDRVGASRSLPPRPADTLLRDWELQHFGSDNSAIAARVLRHWKFPEAIAAVVGGRYLPEVVPDIASGACRLHVASSLAEKIGGALPGERGLFRASPPRLELAGVDWETFSEAEIECGQNLERTRALLKLM